ncbi:hypothetical protein [Rhodoferax sediminis]|uniref:Uncharacterized protein n=1 Tax=Rhodoferax sediminis TaxID=2509614 RepID=A0A515DAB3_9BURK|nr:hypothetical protein [Rhodoferax sediminis]QDL37345.1 hypothetical protein EUB48_08710 [Rhodoferax sediminis]
MTEPLALARSELMPAIDAAGPADQGDENNQKFKQKVPEVLDTHAQLAMFSGAIGNAPAPIRGISDDAS